MSFFQNLPIRTISRGTIVWKTIECKLGDSYFLHKIFYTNSFFDSFFAKRISLKPIVFRSKIPLDQFLTKKSADFLDKFLWLKVLAELSSSIDSIYIISIYRFSFFKIILHIFFTNFLFSFYLATVATKQSTRISKQRVSVTLYSNALFQNYITANVLTSVSSVPLKS